jgi:hypothetical protein
VVPEPPGLRETILLDTPEEPQCGPPALNQKTPSETHSRYFKNEVYR